MCLASPCDAISSPGGWLRDCISIIACGSLPVGFGKFLSTFVKGMEVQSCFPEYWQQGCIKEQDSISLGELSHCFFEAYCFDFEDTAAWFPHALDFMLGAAVLLM